mmetsp:Transcript_6931/g.10288  ORF Transcript_6931/g.10288 Transcript_6931/m.10288 type:complete len:157 (+) Transcript_6931:871-1341(+)
MDWSHLYKNEYKFSTPLLLTAKVVHGFKRGSKELGVPTANLSMEDLGSVGQSLETGIYYGWALLNRNLYKAVVSVGWNPFYKNKTKTVEAHLLQNLDDFYDESISLLLFGYLRQECSFKSLDELKSCIHSDIDRSKLKLEEDSVPKLDDFPPSSRL